MPRHRCEPKSHADWPFNLLIMAVSKLTDIATKLQNKQANIKHNIIGNE